MISKRGTRHLMSVTGVVLSAALVTSAGGSGPARAARACNDSVATAVAQPTAAHMKASGLSKLRVAPVDRRLDLVAAPFSDPTEVTNPLFP